MRACLKFVFIDMHGRQSKWKIAGRIAYRIDKPGAGGYNKAHRSNKMFLA